VSASSRARLISVAATALGTTALACVGLLHVDGVQYAADGSVEATASAEASDDGVAAGDAGRPCSDSGAVEYPFCVDFDHAGLLQGWKVNSNGADDASMALWPTHFVSPPYSARFAMTVSGLDTGGKPNTARNSLAHDFKGPAETRRLDLDFQIFHEEVATWEQLVQLGFALDSSGEAAFLISLVVGPDQSLVATLYDSQAQRAGALTLDQTLPIVTSIWQHVHVRIDFDANLLTVSIEDALQGVLHGSSPLDGSGIAVLSSAPRLSIGIEYLIANSDGGAATARVAFDDIYLDAL
jgi:hypothetical protein